MVEFYQLLHYTFPLAVFPKHVKQLLLCVHENWNSLFTIKVGFRFCFLENPNSSFGRSVWISALDNEPCVWYKIVAGNGIWYQHKLAFKSGKGFVTVIINCLIDRCKYRCRSFTSITSGFCKYNILYMMCLFT